MDKKSSFPLLIWSGLFDEKHRKRMGMAVWLFMLFIDMVTAEKNGVGMVWGGKPINYNDISKRFDFSRRTYQNYLTVLEEYHYITTKKTPHGLIVMVNKSKKRKRLNKADVQDIAQDPKTDVQKVAQDLESDVQDTAHRSAESCTTDVQKVAFRCAESCTTILYSGHNKDYTEDIKKTLVLNSEFKKRIWNELYKIFNLEGNAYPHFEKIIETTIEKHSPYKTISATYIFKERLEDHPPNGKVKNINTFLRFDIDNYVTKVKKLVPYITLTCLKCKKTGKVRKSELDERYKELKDACSYDGCNGKVIVTTEIIEGWLNQGFTSNQIRPLITKYIQEKYDDNNSV